MRKTVGTCLLLILGVVASTACKPGSTATRPAAAATPDEPTYPIRVVCTVGMIADIVRNVGGEHVAVTALMGEGIDPHIYKASPGDVSLLTGADLIFYNGLNLEGRMGDVLVKLARRIPTFPVTEGVSREQLREPPEFKGHYDPHVWFDVSMWMQCAEYVRDRLAEFDPQNIADYESNLRAYLDELRVLDRDVRKRIASIDKSRRILVTAHDAFGYFGRAYDIGVRAIQGLSTESEASVKDINDLVAFIVQRRVKAVFVESSVSRKNITALVEGCRAVGHDITIGGELYSDAMGPADTSDGTYVGMVRHNVDIIVGALK